MAELPEPLTPPDCDLRRLSWFRLDVGKLKSSDLLANESHEVIGMCLQLWIIAWHQVPAASLPNDDQVISNFLHIQFRKFIRLQEKILRGFLLCSDNRLYHRVLAEEANRAFSHSKKFSLERNLARERKRKQREREAGHADVTRDTEVPVSLMSRVTKVSDIDHVTAMSRVETGRDETKEDSFFSPPTESQNTAGVVFGLSAREEQKQEPQKQHSSRWDSNREVPQGWKDDVRDERSRLGMPALDVDLEAAKFSAYYASVSGAAAEKLDWLNAWRSWCLRAKVDNDGGGYERLSAHEKFRRAAAEFAMGGRGRDKAY